MDLAQLQPSRIITVARAAAARPDTEFLCFGESDQPFPASAAQALHDAIDRGDAKYSDVRGVPKLRPAIAHHLTDLHARHSGSPPFAQAGALAAIADADFVDRFRAHCRQGRDLASAGLEGLNGVRYDPPDGAFAFIAIDGLEDSLDFALRLVHDHGVAVAPGIAFGQAGEGALRLCFAQSRPRMERAMERLRAGLQAR